MSDKVGRGPDDPGGVAFLLEQNSLLFDSLDTCFPGWAKRTVGEQMCEVCFSLVPLSYMKKHAAWHKDLGK